MLEKILLLERIHTFDEFEYSLCRCRIDPGKRQPLQNNFYGVFVLIVQRCQHIRLQLVQLLCAKQRQGIRPQNPDNGFERFNTQRAAGFIQIRKQHGSDFDIVDFTQRIQHCGCNQRRTGIQRLHQYINTGAVLDFCQSFHHGILYPFLVTQRLA